ncbi:MAG TPA: SEC-C metal-binding domain-containing protein [Marinagarivorans sp.]
MKVGRNDPCPCGSGKKYKRCCIGVAAKHSADLADDIEQALAMTPNLSLDELNVMAQHKVAQRNNRAVDDFCGLSPDQMFNWMYSAFSELEGVTLTTPQDLSASPVMRYLTLIIDETIANGGSFKATARGNLPTKLVKQASQLLPEFDIARFETDPSISEFCGSNEDKFNALHYTRVLAEIAEIISFKNGRFFITGKVQQRCKEQGVSGFYLPLFETAAKHYNWGYFDGFSDDVSLAPFWLFMLWRIQKHGSLERLIDEVCIAFPDLLSQLPEDSYASPQEQLATLIESRFINRFLQFWGFISIDPKKYRDRVRIARDLTVLPLLKQSLTFSV